jgi:hypothetical protein
MLQIIERDLLTGDTELDYSEVIPTQDQVAAEAERIEYERNAWARKRYNAWANYDVDTLIDDEEPGHIVPNHEPVEEFL